MFSMDVISVAWYRGTWEILCARASQSLQLILQRLPRTIELTLVALVFAILFGTSMGIIAALNHNSWLDYVTVTIALLGVSIPGFWLALLLILVFSVNLGWLPVLSSPGIPGLILPSLALGLWAGGTIARLVRSGMLEVIRQDYVRTAHAQRVAGPVGTVPAFFAKRFTAGRDRGGFAVRSGAGGHGDH